MARDRNHRSFSLTLSVTISRETQGQGDRGVILRYELPILDEATCEII